MPGDYVDDVVAVIREALSNVARHADARRVSIDLATDAGRLIVMLVLLPRDKTPESDKLPQIGASEAVQAATAAVSDMSQFCKRQPTACEVGGQAATVIGQRAADGARKVYSIITDKTEKADKLRPTSRTRPTSPIERRRPAPTGPKRKRPTIPARSAMSRMPSRP